MAGFIFLGDRNIEIGNNINAAISSKNQPPKSLSAPHLMVGFFLVSRPDDRQAI